MDHVSDHPLRYKRDGHTQDPKHLGVGLQGFDSAAESSKHVQWLMLDPLQYIHKGTRS
ncbi:unannotated protein [freshwater metagenome]|uniref:Unannotated protein n=1 Tax=freshwater metagenome TaxID=449393 RepID=A0A6J7G8S2_9ZZZZ